MSDNDAVTDLDILKNLARDMGIPFHPSIGYAALKAKIAEATDASDAEAAAADHNPALEEVVVPARAKRTPAEIKEDALRLVRVRISCMNPAKKEYEADVFCTGNKHTGTMKHVVPFNVPWHVPNMILKMIQQRQCQVFVPKKVRLESGLTVSTRQGKLIKEYAVEILPELSPAELKDLSQRQAMANGTADAA